MVPKIDEEVPKDINNVCGPAKSEGRPENRRRVGGSKGGEVATQKL